VWGVGCGVWGVGCGVWGVGCVGCGVCGVGGVGCGVWCVGCGVWGVECGVWGVVGGVWGAGGVSVECGAICAWSEIRMPVLHAYTPSTPPISHASRYTIRGLGREALTHSRRVRAHDAALGGELGRLLGRKPRGASPLHLASDGAVVVRAPRSGLALPQGGSGASTGVSNATTHGRRRSTWVMSGIDCNTGSLRTSSHAAAALGALSPACTEKKNMWSRAKGMTPKDGTRCARAQDY
jgi:hypothetical protein